MRTPRKAPRNDVAPGAIAALPSLGPVTARRLAEIGVNTEAELRALGAVEAYVRLRFVFGRAVTLNALYGLEAAVTGRGWREITAERKRALREAAARAEKPRPPG